MAHPLPNTQVLDDRRKVKVRLQRGGCRLERRAAAIDPVHGYRTQLHASLLPMEFAPAVPGAFSLYVA